MTTEEKPEINGSIIPQTESPVSDYESDQESLAPFTAESGSKPQMVGIYHQGDFDEEEEGETIYAHLQEDLHKSTTHMEEEEEEASRHVGSQSPFVFRIVIFLAKLLVLAFCGNVLMLLSLETQIYNPMLPKLSDYKVLSFSHNLASLILSKTGLNEVPAAQHLDFDSVDILGNSIFGWFLSFSSYLLFKVISKLIEFPHILSVRGQTLTIFDAATFVRPWIFVVGISYFLRQIEWASQLQASCAWMAVNLLMWYSLDASIAGIFQFSLGSIIAMMVYYVYTPALHKLDQQQILVELMWFGSLVFTSLLFFGKVNSYLFRRAPVSKTVAKA
ncbi:unnamed protein product [Ambrosiozyma monospora]|uniref:Unnamed protein product n=1 Tax=Ambrosiozyma monospora TaxID=43982 RepID=A0A9W6Z1Q3_AMBMO|nr:unnamed protein product [Ambrosiozyma monospora]